MSNEPTAKPRTAKHKADVVMDIFKGKTIVAEIIRKYDLTISEVIGWVEECQSNIKNSFPARPKVIRERD